MSLVPEDKSLQHLVLYFQVHQPRRLQAINFLDLPHAPQYFNDDLNASIMRRIAHDCYIPANALLLRLVEQYPNIRIAFSISGIAIEQMEEYAPEALAGFQQLAATGAVEFLSETYYHSLASLVETPEFETQVLKHAEKITEVFNAHPTVFRNTELIYNNSIGNRVAMLGFTGIITEGHESILNGKTPHAVYTHPEQGHLKILLRNYRLSDDIAFRFMENNNPLDVRRYLGWLNGIPQQERVVMLAMDYETFGEHHKANTGIFEFLDSLLRALAESTKFRFRFPSEVVNTLDAQGTLSVDRDLSWGDMERDLSAWLGNDMQKDAFHAITRLEADIRQRANPALTEQWRYLLTSDHFYYMSIKSDNDGSVHAYFSPFPSSYEAFINYMNVVTHLRYQISQQPVQDIPEHDAASNEAERQDARSSTPVWAMNVESVPPQNVPDSLE